VAFLQAESRPDFAIARKIERNDMGENAMFFGSPNAVRISAAVRSGSKRDSVKRTTAADVLSWHQFFGDCWGNAGGVSKVSSTSTG
jgi:hypothetical protein